MIIWIQTSPATHAAFTGQSAEFDTIHMVIGAVLESDELKQTFIPYIPITTHTNVNISKKRMIDLWILQYIGNILLMVNRIHCCYDRSRGLISSLYESN